MRNYTNMAEKEPTQLHRSFSRWITARTGYEPSDSGAFLKGVQLAVTLYRDYQASRRENSQEVQEVSEVSNNKAEVASNPPADEVIDKIVEGVATKLAEAVSLSSRVPFQRTPTRRLKREESAVEGRK